VRDTEHSQQVLGDPIRRCFDFALGLVVQELPQGNQGTRSQGDRDIDVGDIEATGLDPGLDVATRPGGKPVGRASAVATRR